ncbi:hypothetical protein VdG1_09113 [Verticillium dahliae VDG1]|nr:hypothetical protein VdG1_09113 [Verticillium dahliae VDG1]
MRVRPPRHALVVVVSLIATILTSLAYREALVETVQSRWKSHGTVMTLDGILIKDKVATITDTLFTPHLVPLILYYHAVLGPSWPIVFFTSQTTYDEHLSPNASSSATSATWRRAVDAGSIETRIVAPEFNLTTRKAVNLYFSHPWLWEQLAPAKHVLVFQADAIMCANAAQTVDDFLQDWNTKGTEYGGHGKDYWMSIMMRERHANLPSIETALGFARQLPWHMDRPGRPVGYHRVYKEDKTRVPEARKWCPEIDLSSPGML